METTASISYSKDTFLKTYELDRTKIYQVEKIPDFHTLNKHPNTLLRELSFNSPYIIRYYNIKYDITQQKTYTALEKIKGTSLDQLMYYGCPSFGVVKQIIFKILKGFEIIHLNNQLHRDIHMKNILVEFNFPSFNPKISGFKIYQPSNSQEPFTLGNEAFRAPEVLRYCDYTMQSEVWAIGMLIYHVLAAKFLNSNQPGAPEEINMSVIPNCFKNFIQLALRPNPFDRPETARDLNEILFQDLEPADQLAYDMLD